MKNLVKSLHLFFVLLLSIEHSIGQCLNSETQFKEYYKSNIGKLDPLEGIWSVSHNYKQYKYGSLSNNQHESQVATWAVIKQDNNTFICCDLSGDNSDDPGLTFTKTATESIYLYNNKSTSIKTSAYLKSIGVLEYSYDIPREALKDAFRHMLNQKGIRKSDEELDREMGNNFRVVYEFQWIKTYPLEEDYFTFKSNEEKKHQKSTATGFAISSDGLVVTNYHVIENAENIVIRGVNGDFVNMLHAKVYSSDKNNDLAILKIDDYRFKSNSVIPYVIKNKQEEVGQNINVYGYPLTATMGEEIKFTNGIISAQSGFQGDISMYQISAPIQPGNSGGPMFDNKGNLIGVICAKHLDTQKCFLCYQNKLSFKFSSITSITT